LGCLTLNEKEDVRSIASISEKNHAKQKISCPDGQLIYITTVIGSKVNHSYWGTNNVIVIINLYQNVYNPLLKNICKYNKKRMINRNILRHSFFIGLLFTVLLFSL